MKRPASMSKLVAALADRFADEIEDRLGTLDDSGASQHRLRQDLVKLLGRHVTRTAAGIVAGQPDDTTQRQKH